MEQTLPSRRSSGLYDVNYDSTHSFGSGVSLRGPFSSPLLQTVSNPQRQQEMQQGPLELKEYPPLDLLLPLAPSVDGTIKQPHHLLYHLPDNRFTKGAGSSFPRLSSSHWESPSYLLFSSLSYGQSSSLLSSARISASNSRSSDSL